MPSIKLTDKVVDGLPVPSKTYDTKLPGFGVRVSSGGTRSYFLNYRADGIERRVVIGSRPAWGTTAARAEAKSLKRKIDAGKDPLAEKESKRRAALAERKEPTVARLAEWYMHGLPDPDRPGEFIIEPRLPQLRPESRSAYRRYIDRHILPRLGKMKAKDVTRRDVERLHRSLKDTPTAANRCFAVCGALLQFAVKHEFRDANPCRGGVVERFPEEKRRRYLSQAEMARVATVLAEWPDRTVADAIKFAMLTGARRSEVQSARWADIDLEAGGVWRKPPSATKQKREHYVPLNAPARQLLTDMKERANGSPWLFPSRIAGRHIQHMSHAWPEVAKAAGVKDARLHDLRHSFASIIASSGGSLPLIGSLLGHASVSTTARYSHLFDSAEREAAERVGAFVMGTDKAKAEAVPLRPGRAK